MKRHLNWLMNLWPPFLGAGIRVREIRPDWKVVIVEMKLRKWNANVLGTHYGGSLYSMTDPFYALMLSAQLGPGYVVWDKSSSIRYRKPGKGKVTARFELTDARLDAIREQLKTRNVAEVTFEVQIRDEAGDVVAEIQKLVHAKRVGADRPPTS
ncbi:MAG: YiiD C-terminal domain-containing protein [Candidatus Acidiferrum sp.]